jgi:hypothetical protein
VCLLSQRLLRRALRVRIIITITVINYSAVAIPNLLRDDHLMIGP